MSDRIIAVDFDGTLCENAWPEIGEPVDPVLKYVRYQQQTGAKIILCDPHRATVIGLDHDHRLRPTRMSSPDIRAGVALLIAALNADGRSIIQNIEQIDRGYKDIDGRLNALGAKIIRRDE